MEKGKDFFFKNEITHLKRARVVPVAKEVVAGEVVPLVRVPAVAVSCSRREREREKIVFQYSKNEIRKQEREKRRRNEKSVLK